VVARFTCLLHPLSRTLSPYATLFRSRRLIGQPKEHGVGAGEKHGGAWKRPREGAQDHEQVRAREFIQGQKLRHHSAGTQPGTREDRKSTRLNSSHVKSSYAVVCLKKK